MKTIATIAALFIAITSYAQEGLKEGYKMLGGSFSFSVSESDDDDLFPYADSDNRRNSSFNISPYYGRFYADRQLVGIRLGIFTSNSSNELERYLEDDADQLDYRHLYESNSTRLSLGMFWRYYLPININIGFMVEPAINGYWETSDNNSRHEYFNPVTYERNDYHEYHNELKGYGVLLGINTGFYYFPFPQLSLEVMLGNFVTDFAFGKSNNKILDDLELEDERNYSSFNINFKAANSFRFDELIRLNYYF